MDSLLLAVFILTFSAAAVSENTSIDINALVKQSNLVFEGTVTKVEYASHHGIFEGDGKMPYTYVTFRINKRMLGTSEQQNKLTLRFEGGLAEDDTFLLGTHIPLFDVGDNDLLFVGRNREADCPLVHCKHSRFRIIDKRIYTDGGRQIVMTSKNEIRAGIYEKIPDVVRNMIGDTEIELESLVGPGEEDADTQLRRNPLPKNSAHISKTMFSDMLQRKITQSVDQGQLAVLEMVADDNLYIGPTKRIKPAKPPQNN